MKLIIDIPEKVYQNAKDDMLCGSELIVNAIKKGTPIEQEPCDCISRAEAIENIKHAQFNFSVKSEIDFTKYKREVQEIADGILNAQIKALSEMPSVQPEQKTGHWIYSKVVNTGEITWSECSVCGNGELACAKRMKYCPKCGAKMEG